MAWCGWAELSVLPQEVLTRHARQRRAVTLSNLGQTVETANNLRSSVASLALARSGLANWETSYTVMRSRRGSVPVQMTMNRLCWLQRPFRLHRHLKWHRVLHMACLLPTHGPCQLQVCYLVLLAGRKVFHMVLFAERKLVQHFGPTMNRDTSYLLRQLVAQLHLVNNSGIIIVGAKSCSSKT